VSVIVGKFVVHPNVFKRLPRGRAVLIRKDPFRCEIVRIQPHDNDPWPEATIEQPVTAKLIVPTSPPAFAQAPRAETAEELDALFSHSD